MNDYLQKNFIDEVKGCLNKNSGGTGGTVLPDGTLVVDSQLSETSTNPIQNKAVTKVLKDFLEDGVLDTGSGVLTPSVAKGGTVTEGDIDSLFE